MIRGICFEIPLESNKSFLEIFTFKDTEKYYWHIIHSQTEVWDPSFSENYFKNDVYTGADLKELVEGDHIAVFVKMQGYCSPGSAQSIPTYEEFLKSDCCIMFLLYDSQYVEIYSKNEATSKKLFQYAVENNFINVSYITSENDYRTKMDII